MNATRLPRLCQLTLVAALLMSIGPASADQCLAETCTSKPQQYPVGWLPWLADLKSWRNYNPAEIPGLGRLTRSPDGSVHGERLNPAACEVLSPGKYVFAMKYQENEVTDDYMNNTDVLYLKPQEGVGRDYIRHSQVAAGFPVFCAGEFHISASLRLSLLNELVEVNNFSGHYKPQCRCLGVLLNKLEALGVKTQETEVKFMGSPKDC
ncbi:hypothetical protein [Pyxidicoccus trucidator]|uniref:hypothetical protein n=1 Tax=Pyxidicoccus trucidator TaxID=2709662 RepID=UPI0013DC9390|nr:hypothetical protein [Pyxidicoccus trucidator]